MRERVLMDILKWPVAVWMKTVFHTEVIRNDLDKNEGPAIFLGNHVTFEDAIMAILYTNRPISFLAARINYDNPFKKVIFDLFRIVPFTKGEMDIKAIKELKRLIDKGRSVGLYPEGGRTWDGSNIYIIESISNLIKLLKVPVYYIDLRGFYLVKPRWAKKYRKGKTTMGIVKVLDKDQVKKLSSDEVLTEIKKSLTYNEYERQRENKVAYRGKDLAESIEKVIFKCPNCMAVNSHTSKGEEFWCKECGKKYTVDEVGFIHGSEQFDNLHSWNVWQRQFIDEIYENNLPFANEDVKLTMVENNRLKKRKSSFIIDKDGVRLGDIYIPADKVSSPNIVFTNVVEFFSDKIKYRLKMDPKKHMSITLAEHMLRKMVEVNLKTE
ncbi:MAG: 1-acyl-sn-glycerol-3-phosphate acyltransferase [Clostridia bacterium]|nr:1-acyl-sn-glycerol-3-phosphate acyltransferase [Clostridia bacterium]